MISHTGSFNGYDIRDYIGNTLECSTYRYDTLIDTEINYYNIKIISYSKHIHAVSIFTIETNFTTKLLTR